MKQTDQIEALRCSDWFASVFPTGEARSVNVGTERKPCWIVEGPEPSAADWQWAREVALGAINQLSARVQNLGQPPTLESSQDDARKSGGAAGSGDTSGMSMRAESISANAAGQPRDTTT